LGIVHCVEDNQKEKEAKKATNTIKNQGKKSKSTMMDIVNWGRLANVTKKVAIIASVVDQQPICFCVEWQNPEQ
jgi:tRNA splicing endonuclease